MSQLFWWIQDSEKKAEIICKWESFFYVLFVKRKQFFHIYHLWKWTILLKLLHWKSWMLAELAKENFWISEVAVKVFQTCSHGRFNQANWELYFRRLLKCFRLVSMEHDECLQRMIEINQVENNITLLYSDLPSHQLRDDCLGLVISRLKERNQSAKNMQNITTISKRGMEITAILSQRKAHKRGCDPKNKTLISELPQPI